MIAAIARWVLAGGHPSGVNPDQAHERLVDWVFRDPDNWAYAEREGFRAAYAAMEKESAEKDLPL